MKKIRKTWIMVICFLICMLLSCVGVSAEAQKSSPVNKLSMNMRMHIYNEYSKLVAQKEEDGDYYVSFACEDVNGDNIPELFIHRYYKGKKYEKNYDHEGYDIYTYKNGKAKKISDIHGGLGIMKYRKNVLVCRNVDIISVYKWEKGHYVRKGHYIYSTKTSKQYAVASNKYVGEHIYCYKGENKKQQLKYLKNLLNL
ncbi:MAG: hypothetical protein U0O03_11830 [Blautia wexlerae]